MAEDIGKVTCNLILEFPSAEHARKVFQAVEQDNDEYVDARQDGGRIVASMSAGSLSSLLHTLDDLLSCMSVAEKIVSKDE